MKISSLNRLVLFNIYREKFVSSKPLTYLYKKSVIHSLNANQVVLEMRYLNESRIEDGKHNLTLSEVCFRISSVLNNKSIEIYLTIF